MGKKKIEIKYIEKKSSRQVSFSKRRTGLFKKALEFGRDFNLDIALVVFSEKGRVYECGNTNHVLRRFLGDDDHVELLSPVSDHDGGTTTSNVVDHKDVHVWSSSKIKRFLNADAGKLSGDDLDDYAQNLVWMRTQLLSRANNLRASSSWPRTSHVDTTGGLTLPMTSTIDTGGSTFPMSSIGTGGSSCPATASISELYSFLMNIGAKDSSFLAAMNTVDSTFPTNDSPFPMSSIGTEDSSFPLTTPSTEGSYFLTATGTNFEDSYFPMNTDDSYLLSTIRFETPPPLDTFLQPIFPTEPVVHEMSKSEDDLTTLEFGEAESFTQMMNFALSFSSATIMDADHSPAPAFYDNKLWTTGIQL